MKNALKLFLLLLLVGFSIVIFATVDNLHYTLSDKLGYTHFIPNILHYLAPVISFIIFFVGFKFIYPNMLNFDKK